MNQLHLFKRACWLVLLILLGMVRQTSAGGWAVVTVSELPAAVMAGEPFVIEFAVRQHGQRLVGGVPAAVTAVHAAIQEEVTVSATEAAEYGYYEASLILPSAGEWQWAVQTWGVTYTMPPLTVNSRAASEVATTGKGLNAVLSAAYILFAAGAAGAVLAFVAWWRKRTVARLGLVLGAIAIAALGASEGWQGKETAVVRADSAAVMPAIASEDLGEALFVAKGCISCHQHDNVAMADTLVTLGPNLTHYKGNPDYLVSWLNNPANLKPETQMPQLGLSASEIDILINFLSQ